MLTQAEEEMEAAPDRQEETTTLVMVKKKKCLFLKILDAHQTWDESAEEVECK